MKLIKLSAACWTQIDDFYTAILKSIAAPEWHGHNINALIDSMIYEDINGVNPPYKIIICETGNLNQALKDKIAAHLFYIVQARDEAPFVPKPDIRIIME